MSNVLEFIRQQKVCSDHVEVGSADDLLNKRVNLEILISCEYFNLLKVTASVQLWPGS